jgi:ABC-type polysaccharide transport system permease subunit
MEELEILLRHPTASCASLICVRKDFLLRKYLPHLMMVEGFTVSITAEKINKVVKRLLYLENEVSWVQLEGVFDAVLAESGIIKLIMKSEILMENYALCHK